MMDPNLSDCKLAATLVLVSTVKLVVRQACIQLSCLSRLDSEGAWPEQLGSSACPFLALKWKLGRVYIRAVHEITVGHRTSTSEQKSSVLLPSPNDDGRGPAPTRLKGMVPRNEPGLRAHSA